MMTYRGFLQCLKKTIIGKPTAVQPKVVNLQVKYYTLLNLQISQINSYFIDNCFFLLASCSTLSRQPDKSLNYYLANFHIVSMLVHYFKYSPFKKLKRKAKESGRGARDTDPHPICSPRAAPSISFVPPPATGVSCLFGSKPSKPSVLLKPEQHGGELNHGSARWEFLADTEQEKARLLDDAKAGKGCASYLYNNL